MKTGLVATQQSTSEIDHDILPEEIDSYLSADEIINLKLASFCLNEQVNSLSIRDVLWQPFLDRLKALDPTLSVTEPVNEECSVWRFPLFKKSIAQIEQNLLNEIKNFPYVYESSEFKTLLKKKGNKLSKLEKIDDILNNLNAALIEKAIDINSNTLDLSMKGITRFPKQLFENPTYKKYWSTLQYLNCSYNKLKTLPDLIGNCEKLQEINCSFNQLKFLPNSIGKCRALQKIWCSNNQLKFLPDSIGKCVALQFLHCSCNNLRFLPASITKCRALKKLWCSNNKVKCLPDLIGCCTNLQVLCCTHNELEFLPDSIGKCVALKELWCSFNKLRSLPNSVGDCLEIEVISFGNNQLRFLPDSIGKWKVIQRLYCSHNQLAFFPEVEWKTLQLLDCSNNKLRYLPDLILNYEIQDLDCSFNQIILLPSSIGNALKRLVCNNNVLQFLPDLFSNCLDLQELNCSYNELTLFPNSIIDCKKLNSLNCANNHFLFLPGSLIQKFGKMWLCEMSKQKVQIGNDFSQICIGKSSYLSLYNIKIHSGIRFPLHDNQNKSTNIKGLNSRRAMKCIS